MGTDDELRPEDRLQHLGSGTRAKYLESYREADNVAFLDEEAFSFVEEIARKRNTDVSTVVNQLIKLDRKIVDCARSSASTR